LNPHGFPHRLHNGSRAGGNRHEGTWGNMRQGRIKTTRYHPTLHDAPPGGDPGRCRTTRGFDRGFRQAGWPHREEETPIKKHPLHRRVKRVHIVNLEPSRPDADRRTLDGSNTVTLAPQMCRSTNRQVEPEVWFRVVHLGHDGPKGTPVAYYREQPFKFVLRLKGDFGNNNVGIQARRIADCTHTYDFFRPQSPAESCRS